MQRSSQPPVELEPCPQCGGRLVVMRGDGVIETLCSACGFVMRQHPAKPVAHEPYELTRLGDVIPEPIVTVLRRAPRPRHRIHPLWFMGWALALGCMYIEMTGASSYLPIYLADKYLMMFGMALGIHRILYADRSGEPLPDGPLPIMALFLGSFLCGELAARLAPRIGERNYCYATTMSLLTREVPHLFRCTYSPFFFAGFVAAFWILGWAMVAIEQRRDG